MLKLGTMDELPVLREVFQRTGDKPFKRIEDVISAEEIREISERYKAVSGFQKAR